MQLSESVVMLRRALARVVAHGSVVAVLVVAAVVAGPVSPASASSSAFNVTGTPGNASVALTWSAPTSGLPMAFGARTDASVGLGGWGGNEWRLNCPTGYAVTGVGTAGNLTSVQFRCTQVQADGTWAAGAAATNLAVYHATATSWQYCPVGQVAVAVLGGSNFHYALGLRCAEAPSGTGAQTTTSYTAARSGTEVASACATGQVVTGFYVRTGAWIDQVRSSCATWASTPITNYTIQYSSNSGSSWTTFSATASSATSRTVTGLTNGTSYVFRVAHVANGVTGTYSETSPAYVPFTTPAAPTALTGVRGNTQVALTWSAPTSDNGRSITDYVIQYTSNNGSTWTTFADGVSTGTSTTVTGLTNGTTYLFRVAAVNQAGTGTYSANSSGLVPATVPNAPGTITSTFGDGRVTLSWTAPGTGGSAITDYVAQHSLVGGSNDDDWTTFADAVSTTASIAVTGLTNYATYYFRVAAKNVIGQGAYSAAITAVPGVTPGAATPTIAALGNTEVSISWNTNVTASASVTDWIVQYSTNNSTWITFADGVSTNGSATVTGLTNGTGYYFRVAAVNPATTGSYGSSVYGVPRTVPNAPLITTATPLNTQISLSWSAPANGGNAISDYDIEYRLSSSATWIPWAPATVSTATSVTITGLTNGSAYVFRVSAKNAAGSGAFSAMSAPTTPRTFPDAPGVPVLVPGDRRITLTWTAPASNGGNAITDYEIQRYDGSNVWLTDGVSSATSYVDTTVTNGRSYQYWVRAKNAAGVGSGSGWSLAAVPFGLPSAPTSVAGTAGLSEVTLSWAASSNNGSAITDYVIEYSSDGGATWTAFSRAASTATSSVRVTGLTNGTPHVFRVAAVNGAGTGSWSVVSAARTPQGAPEAPTDVAGVASDRQIALSWTAPNANGSPITDYIIQYSANGGAWTTYSDGTSTATTSTLTGLTNGASYVFRVAARNAVGTGSYSTSSAALVPRTVPGAPTSVAGSTGPRRATITFAAPSSNGGSAITGYAVRSSTDGGVTWSETVLTGATSTSFALTGLTPATAHVFSVAAINAAGQGAWSTSSASVTVQDYAGAPTNVTGVEGDRQIALSWEAPASNGGSIITNYRVEYSSDNGTTWTHFAFAASTATTRVVTGLTNGTNYVFRVAAINGWGYENFSLTSAVLNPFTLPGAPASTSPSPGSSQATVTWTAAAANGRAITDYLVQFSANNGVTWVTFADGTSASTSAVVTGLTNGIAYRFRIAAVSAAGTGAYSAASISVTPRAVPSTPLNVVGVGGNARVSLSWSMPVSNGGSAIVDYTVRYSADSGANWTTFVDSVSSATSVSVTGLTNGVGYLFQVSASNALGAGGYSVSSSSVTPFTVPGQPISVSGTAGVGQIELGWSAPASDGGASITDYVVEYSSNGGSTWVTFADGESSSASATVTGLSNGTSYVFRVTARNAAGTGSASTASTAVSPRTAPSAAQAVSGVAGNAQVSLSWSAPVVTGGSSITDYVVQYSSDGTNWSVFADGVSTATSGTVTGLTNGVAYVFRVAAVNDGGTGSFSVASAAVTPFTVPDAPSAVTVVPGDGRIAVSWTAPTSDGGNSIVQYQVQVAPQGSDNYGTWSAASATQSSATTFTATGLTNGTSYKVRVAATNAAGDGAYSTPSDAVVAYTTPDTPTSVSGIPGDGDVTVSWSAPASDGGDAVSDYVVQYSSDSGATWVTFDDGVSSSTSATVTGLSNGTSYMFRVSARNAAGAGSVSTSSSGIVPRTVPDAPTSATATAGNEQVTLAWTAPAFDGGAAITDYLVEYSQDGESWALFSDDVSALRAVAVTELENGTPYYFRVYAINEVGMGAASASSLPVTPRTVPTSPTISRIVTESASLTVYFAPGDDGGNPITTYEYSTDGGATWQVRRVGSVSSPLVITALSTNGTTALSNGTTYSVQVRAVNSAGSGSASRTVIATPITIPGPPIDVLTAPGNAAISLNWTAPAFNGGTSIIDYEVEYSADGGVTWFSIVDGVSTSTSASVTSLANGTQYRFRVTAINGVGAGPSSLWTTSVAPRTTPSAPTNLTLVADAGSIRTSWTAGSSGGSSVTDYVVEYSTDGSTWATFNDGLSTATNTVITGLTNGTAYHVRVSAVNVAGTSTAVVSSSTVTPRTTPGEPSISSVVGGNGTLDVAFTAGSTGGSAITSYRYSLDGGATWSVASGTTSPIRIGGLVNGTQYQVAVRAVNAIGVGEPSNVLSGTPRTVPGAPTISGITAGANQGVVVFVSPTDGGAAIVDIEYRVKDGTWSNWRSAGSTSSPLTMTNLANGTTYEVEIRAVNVAGAGPASNIGTVTPFTSPGSPTITGVSGGVGQVTVSFAPGATGGATITNYQYSIDGGTTWVALSPASTTSPITVSGLASGTRYDVQMRAVNVAGPGLASDGVSVTTKGVPSAPTVVSSTSRDGAVELTLAPGANGGEPVTNYEYSIDGGSTWVTRSPASIASPLTVAGLVNGTTYGVQVRSVNSAGVSAPSATSDVMPRAVPAAPTLTSQTAGDRTISVAFTAGGSGGAEILYYEYSTDRGATWVTRADSGGTGSPLVITTLSSDGSTSLVNGTTYDIQLRAVNMVGVGVASNDIAGTPVSSPAAPSNLEIVNGDRSLQAFFRASSNGGSVITGYEYSTDGGTTWRTASGFTSPLTITALSADGSTPLVNGHAYPVQVRAVNAQGAGSAAGSVSGTPRTTAGAPTSVSLGTGDRSITVTFAAPLDTGGSAVTGYEYSTDGGATWRLRAPGDSMTSSPIVITALSSDGLTPLSNGIAYDVLIRPINDAGPGAESITQTAIPSGVPNAPTVTAVTSGNEQLTIAFTPGGSGGNAVLRNEYSLDGGATWRVAPGLGSEIVVTDLNNGTPYAVQVRQVNAMGVGGSSATVEGVPYTRPAVVTIDQVVAGNGSLAVHFTAGSNGGNATTTYQYSTDGGATWITRTAGTVESPLLITALSSDGTTPLVNGQFYGVKIRAVNAAGSSAASESVRIAPFTVPTAPVVSSISMRNSYALLSYAVASNGGAPITAYEYSLNGGLTWRDAASTDNPLRISGLRNGETYSVILRAVNRAGAGAASATSSISPIGPPDAPRISTLTPGNQTLEVAFIAGATSGAAIIGYEYSIDGGNTWPSAGSTTTSPITISGLTNGSVYTVRIRAVNGNGVGTPSEPVLSKPYTVPSAPTITNVVLEGNDATVDFAPPASDGGQAVTTYEYSIDSGMSWVSTGSSSVMSVQITNLVEGQNYEIGVRAVNPAGAGEAAMVNSLAAEVAPAPATPPAAPSRPSTPDRAPSEPAAQEPASPNQPSRPAARPISAPASPPSLAVLPGSGGIAVAPGNGAAVIGGRVVDLIVNVAPNGGGLVVLENEFTFRITPRDANGNVVRPGDSNSLRALKGRTVEIAGEGFAPNSVIEAWVNSTPILLGEVPTNAAGEFAKVFDLPPGIEVGVHTLTLSGTSKGGDPVAASIGLVVEDDVADEEQVELAPAVEPSESDQSSGTMTLYGVLIVLTLAGLVVLARRRKRIDESVADH